MTEPHDVDNTPWRRNDTLLLLWEHVTAAIRWYHRRDSYGMKVSIRAVVKDLEALYAQIRGKEEDPKPAGED